ncbi:hypothetical protein HJC23_010347 [Cyclotella cryptica]|uniref:CDAN1-interacting nuclease 1 n=1 Tax=Cyclotella cryptica TaxID=29204 RepID=A0ABD3QPE2_9STRA|eukprot:CCRYP_003767-RC/>CCRYP_003767-RC protein AED:0.15 eAED:0.15 QI:76/-1/1/1/-1/1/1/1/391
MNQPQKRRRDHEIDSSSNIPPRAGNRFSIRSNSNRARTHGGNTASRVRRRHGGGNKSRQDRKRPARDDGSRKLAADAETTSLSSSSAAASTSSSSPNWTSLLHWPDPTSHYVPVSEEHRLLPALIQWGRTERGMMRDQPEFRLRKILKLLGTNASGVPETRRHSHSNGGNKGIRINLLQSLSLRRHHLKLLNPNLSMQSLRLGSDSDILAAATLFELCVECHLKEMGVAYWTEEDQRRMHDETHGPTVKMPPTPDFRVRDGHLLGLHFTPLLGDGLHRDEASSKRNKSHNNTATSQQPITINWIEAKMFYGASTIPSSTNNAVGTILPKARQYVAHYGPGAMVFMYGCGSELAQELKQVGVVALDSRGLDLERVVRHQVGWCGDGRGNVLF